MAYTYIGKDIYKQLEQVMEKLNESLSINKELNDTIKELIKSNKEKDKQIEKLLNEIDRLKNQNNKNSSNSSKSSSTDIFKPKKFGANLYNYRIKSDKKPGGQTGHKGNHFNKEKVEKLIDDKKIKVITIEHIIKVNSSKNDVIKYKIRIDIKSYVEKHIFKHDSNAEEMLPQEFYTDVTYDNSIKALSIELSTYNVISYDRLSDFFNVITNGILNIKWNISKFFK